MAHKGSGKTHHVVHNPDGGWDVKRGGSERASDHFETKREAIDYGRGVSRNQSTELKIHNQDGRATATAETRTLRVAKTLVQAKE